MCRRRAAYGGNAHPGMCGCGCFFSRRTRNILWIITCYDAGARLTCNRSSYSTRGRASCCCVFEASFASRKESRAWFTTAWHEGGKWERQIRASLKKDVIAFLMCADCEQVFMVFYFVLIVGRFNVRFQEIILLLLSLSLLLLKYKYIPRIHSIY